MLKRSIKFLIIFGLSAIAGATTQSGEYHDLNSDTQALDPARTFESPLTAGLDVQYIPRSYSKYEFAPGVVGGDGGYGFNIGLEWVPLTEFGKVGIGGGVGLFVLPNRSVGTDGAATLYTIPIEMNFSYRFDYLKHQILVPYVKFGPSVTLASQRSNFGFAKESIPLYKGLGYGAGIALNLGAIERSAAKEMDMTFGINGTYLAVEYVGLTGLGTVSADADFGHTEFRVGLRFEM